MRASTQSSAARLALTALVLLAANSSSLAEKTVTVQISLPVEAKMPTDGIRRILIGGFLANDHPAFDLQKEISRLLRTDLKRNSDFQVLDDPPINLPEQNLEDLKKNAMFFQAVGDDYRADLLVTGRIIFDASDQSGFAQEEYISPLSGRRSVRTRYVERTGFQLRIDLIFVRGSDGSLVYDTTFIQDEIIDSEGIDPLTIFYVLAERFRERYLSILMPRVRNESRYLFLD